MQVLLTPHISHLSTCGACVKFFPRFKKYHNEPDKGYFEPRLSKAFSKKITSNRVFYTQCDYCRKFLHFLGLNFALLNICMCKNIWYVVLQRAELLMVSRRKDIFRSGRCDGIEILVFCWLRWGQAGWRWVRSVALEGGSSGRLLPPPPSTVMHRPRLNPPPPPSHLCCLEFMYERHIAILGQPLNQGQGA